MKKTYIRGPKPGYPTMLVCSMASGLGDALLKLPMLVKLRQLFPRHHITFMHHERYHESSFHNTLLPIVESLIDAVISDISVNSRLMRACIRRSYKYLIAPKHPYDIIIDTDTRIKNTIALKAIPHQTFITAAAGFWLSHYRPEAGYQRPLHVAQRQGDLAYIAARLAVQPIKNMPATLDNRWHELAIRCLPPGPCYIGFAPGAGHPTRPKRWPLERFIAIAKQQAQHGRVPTFFLGLNELAWQAQIAREVPSAVFPETHPDVADDKGPCLVVALGYQLQFAVCNDNGIAHMLAAANTPLVSLFGPTSADKFMPLSTCCKVLRSQQWGTDRMDSIPLQDVRQAVEELHDLLSE